MGQFIRRMRTIRFLLLAIILPLIATRSMATSVLPIALPEQVENADAICRATVLGWTCFRGGDGGIHTRTVLKIDDAIKGTFPSAINVIHRGGILDNREETLSTKPNLHAGDQIIAFLRQRPDGTLFIDNGSAGVFRVGTPSSQKATTGYLNAGVEIAEQIRRLIPDSPGAGADVTSQAAAGFGNGLKSAAVTGLLTSSGIAARFLNGDRGEPIEYLVDTDALPSGISTNQALTALSNAFAAWAGVASVSFRYSGPQSFGKSAVDASTNVSDSRIRVQLHDLYNQINSSSILGEGGRLAITSGSFPNGGIGGNVAGNEFNHSVAGYLTMEHTNSAFNGNPVLFEEVLTHEIGHVLSMGHSSENPSEANTNLTQAIMYFTAHDDGRGARVEGYDKATIQQIHPTNNTPPFTFDRVFDAVTTSSALNVSGINEITVSGGDLQTSNTNLSVVVANPSNLNGTFSLVSTTIKYAPLGLFTDSTSRHDPFGNSFSDAISYRLSDGTNSSPWAIVKILSLLGDTKPSGGPDGIPDAWMTQFFGNSDPAAGAKRGASDDFDGDGISNLDEFRIGTDPTSTNSVLKIIGGLAGQQIDFLARPGDLYQVQGTTNLTDWFDVALPVIATSTNQSVTNFFEFNGSAIYVRVRWVP